MKNVQKLLVTTALVAFIAAPAAALTLDANTQIGSYEMIYPPVDPTDSTGPATGDATGSVAGSGAAVEPPPDPDDSVGPATGDGAANDSAASSGGAAVTQPDPTDSTGPATGDDGDQATIAEPAMAPGMQIDAESAFIGNRVLSSDGVEIGVVQEVVTQSDGSKLLVVVQNGGTESESRFTLTVDGAATADGEISLGWTEAELSAAVGAL
jgi:hypothetical protein